VVGHTRTLPSADADVSELKFAVFSCANLPKGYFHSYAHAADQATTAGDIDAVIHLGDYLYEYDSSGYPSLVGRGDNNTDTALFSPNKELTQLADYRLRHAQYKSDPDLQELQRLVPFIAVWDDHESSNDAWKNGAENHDEATEGSWTERKAAKKGVEPESVEVGTFHGKKLVFIGAERANAVGVYDISDIENPKLNQILSTGIGPEGLLAIEKRNLFISANEVDTEKSITIFQN